MSGSGRMDSFNFEPIGFFKGAHANKYDAPRQSVEDDGVVLGKVQLKKGFNLEQGLKGLNGFKRIWLIYKFHKNDNWKPVTNTPRATEKQGVFATRSPYRPNPIGMSCVELVDIGSDYLVVKGHDLLDETPILDIKPYVPVCDQFDVVNESWIEEENLKAVEFSKEALEKVIWLESKGVSSLKGFVIDQLKRDPLNSKKKRVIHLDKALYQLSYRTWRIQFEYDESAETSRVLSILSGYTKEELLESVDQYQDKEVHKLFGESFGIS